MWITRKSRAGSREFRQISPRAPLLVLIALLVLPALAQAVPQSLADLAQRADTAYRDGDYDDAVTRYREILDAGYSSGPLLYNLGNAYYKSGRLGEAILMYERALRKMPHNDDVRHNLDLARERAVDRVEPPPRLFVWAWIDVLRDLFPPRMVAISAWSLALLTALFVVAVLNTRGERGRALFRSLAVLFAVLFALNISLVGLRLAAEGGDPAAIVLAPNVTVHAAPDNTAQQVFTLHEGTRVDVLQRVESWAEIRLADGRQGWLPAAGVEEI